MKTLKTILAAVLLLTLNCKLETVNCFAQGIGINTTGATADPSAMFDISATNKGLLIPRMTTAQRNAIVSPALGLQIFNTTTSCLEIYNTATSTWQSIYCLCTIPGAPTANAASSVASTSFSANWTASAGATAYLLDVATDAGFTVFVGVFNNFNVGNVVTYPVTGLTSGTTYYYRVRANNTCGTSGNSGTITVTTTSCYTPGTQTFSYTGAVQTFTVGCGVTSITVDVKGAKGGNGTFNAPVSGGLGGRVQGNVAVTAGQVLQIYVGGAGIDDANSSSNTPGGFNGGGIAYADATYTYYGGGSGGGASDIRISPYALSNRIVVAGGGGGAGSDGCTSFSTLGGAGGGLTGGAGAPGSLCSCNPSGQGGTQSAGGAQGNWGCACNATAGSFGVGGDSNSSSCGGPTGAAGGGGGYYGGGGGGLGAGGGGSSYTSGSVTGVTHTQGFQSGNGQIIITW